MRRLVPTALALLTAGTLVVTAAPSPAAPAAPTAATSAAAPGKAFVEKAQRRLNRLDCNAGPADGDLGPWTRSAVVRFQTRHHLKVSGHLTRPTRQRLFSERARQCDYRPVPARTGEGRRIVLSQHQNWVWLVGPRGGIVAQGGMVDLPSELGRGWHRTGSYCGRAARIERNTTSSGVVWLENFVRFAPCGIGFHRIPTYQSNGAQMHPDWYLGTNFTQSHGCIRLSRAMSEKVWRFTTSRTRVRVV